jgi:RNA polymerase sigma factor (sigma-70 family)
MKMPKDPLLEDALILYYKEVEGTKMLNAEEEHALIVKYHETKDKQSKNKIIKGALRYVINEARKHSKNKDRSCLEDLIAAGNIGLVRALDKFNPTRNTRFLTYAGWWVRHEMREEARRLGFLHVPAHAIAQGVHIPAPMELNDSILIQTETTQNAIEVLETQQSVTRLLELTALSVREVFIIKTCYGIHTAPKTLRQIGKLLDITGERVRQLRENAILKLRTSASNQQILPP